jgi:hypothetical protein
MARIRLNDPARRHLHDYVVTDPFAADPDGAMGKVLAAFSSYRGALSYVATHGRGHVWIITTLHPDGCDCDDAPALDSRGRSRQRRGARN